MQGGDQDDYASYPAYRYLRDNTRGIFSGVLASSPEGNSRIWPSRCSSASRAQIRSPMLQLRCWWRWWL
jgi:hypothetical protein